MPLSLPFLRGLRIVDHRYEPVPVLSNIEDHVTIHIIGVPENTAKFLEIMPSDSFHKLGDRLST
jgi:hypothetical protein